MGLKEDYRLKKLIKEMHKLHCEVKKCCDGEGGDGLSCDDLENCQEIIDIKDSIPTNTSELVNDSGYLVCEDLENCQEIIDIKDSIPTDISDLTDEEELLFSGDYNDLDNKPTIPTNTSELANDSGYLVCEDLENCQEIIDIKDSIPTDISDLTDEEELLFSGDYNDLDNKPTIPTNTSELANDSGYLACDDLENCQEIIDIKDSIPDIFIERSLPDLHVDIANNALVPGATYKITGVHKAHAVDFPQIGELPISALYDDGRDLGTTIFLKAISENELETFGSGIFYNPKYDKQVQGFGIWSNTAPSYNVDDVVFWGGYAWKNLNGNIGANTDILSLDGEWEKLNYDDANYNRVVDYIEYDIENDIITRRYDTVNEVDVSSGFFAILAVAMKVGLGSPVPVSLMQWGNDLYFSSNGMVGVGNISVKHMSFVELINFKGGLINNVTFDKDSSLYNVTFDNGSRLENVTFDNGSNLMSVTFGNDSSFKNVTFDKYSSLYNVTFDNGSGLYNTAFDKDSELEDVTFDNGSSLNNVTFNDNSSLKNVTLDEYDLRGVTFDNGSSLNNVTFENSEMRNNTFINFKADFNYQTYSNLEFSNIKFEGRDGVIHTVPDISSATIITDINIPQKKVFGIDVLTQKIQYWDSVSNDFVVADITD